ncbi:MAG: hypothetical protein U0610_25075 [bacterium]
MALPLSYSVRSALARRTTTLLTAIGLALVVFVFAGARMLSDGLAKTMVDTGSPLNAVAIRRGSQTEVQSVIMRDSASIIASQPEIATDSDGQPLATGESVVLVVLKKRGTTGSADGVNVTIRGVSPKSMTIRGDQVKLVEGRMFQPGLDEVIAARSVAKKFPTGRPRRSRCARWAAASGRGLRWVSSRRAVLASTGDLGRLQQLLQAWSSRGLLVDDPT